MTRDDVSVVIVAYNALPWLEQCLESVAGYETVVVDHGSTDGTVAFVREQVSRRQRRRAGEPRARRGLEPRHPRDRAARTS